MQGRRAASAQAAGSEFGSATFGAHSASPPIESSIKRYRRHLHHHRSDRHKGPAEGSQARRKSASDSSARTGHRKEGRIEMLLLQRTRGRRLAKYPNRDSLSSPSSPPSSFSTSSSSPSSSSSSSSSSSASSGNQTSGNCSAASSALYASSSLSCSSPFLALGAAPLASSNKSQLLTEPLIVEQREPEAGSSTSQQQVAAPGGQLRASEKSAPGGSKPDGQEQSGRLSVIEESVQQQQQLEARGLLQQARRLTPKRVASLIRLTPTRAPTSGPTSSPFGALGGSKQQFQQQASLIGHKHLHSHYATMNRLNNYLISRAASSSATSRAEEAQAPLDATIEFQCLDCDQLIQVDRARVLLKTDEIRQLREHDINLNSFSGPASEAWTPDRLERAYVAALNGLPLCKSCEKKRVERKEIVSEFVETELTYGRDLKIIQDEFYRPMQIAGLLSKDQINGIFLNLEELIMAHYRFADRLGTALSEAHAMGDVDYGTVNIGKLFVESADMLHTFESYCIRQGSAACLLARLAKEKELLRIFLRVSQMENTLLRRMNLAAFLMVPVQRVTKYPLLLNRLYKVTPYHHKDREALRDAQLKVELHLEHINQQTKGISATNKIWRRISSLSSTGPVIGSNSNSSNNRRGMITAEDIGYIKLRNTAMQVLKWDRDEAQFIHSGWISFAPLSEFLTKQKMKPLRYLASHALLIVLGKPNWKYRPDLVKSNLDSKLMIPTPGGTGIKEAALLLFREKNGRFILSREPLFLSNCVLSADCSQFNNECPSGQQSKPIVSGSSACNPTAPAASQQQQASAGPPSANRKSPLGQGRATAGGPNGRKRDSAGEFRAASAESGSGSAKTGPASPSQHHTSAELIASRSLCSRGSEAGESAATSGAAHSIQGDSISMSSLPEEQNLSHELVQSTLRSYSLASALPRAPIGAATKTTSNLTILNQLMTKVNNYHHHHHHRHHHHHHHHHHHKLAEPKAAGTASAPLESTAGEPAQRVELGAGSLDLCANGGGSGSGSAAGMASGSVNHYNHLFFHHQPYGDYEESFEIHERLTKESLLLRADTPLKTRYWLQMLRYHAKDLGQWRARRNGLANIMMMRQE